MTETTGLETKVATATATATAITTITNYDELRAGGQVRKVPAQTFVEALATHLKNTGKINIPEWHDIVKTGTFKELCPNDPDWLFIRAASMLRHVYLRQGTGIGTFTRVYGGKARKTRSTRRPHFVHAAKGLHRYLLKQLEKMDLVSTGKDRKGRWMTAHGQKELDTIANRVLHTPPQRKVLLKIVAAAKEERPAAAAAAVAKPAKAPAKGGKGAKEADAKGKSGKDGKGKEKGKEGGGKPAKEGKGKEGKAAGKEGKGKGKKKESDS